jgi:hypothetical protein
MQTTVTRFCDKMMFFPQVPFIQMHMMNNISLNLLIETWIQMNEFIMKRNVWLFIDNKFIS